MESPPDSEKQYLTKAELCALTGLSSATIQRYKDRGKIPYYQIGGKGARVLFKRDALEAMRAGPQQDAATPEQGQAPPSTTSAGEKSARAAKRPGPKPRWQRPSQS